MKESVDLPLETTFNLHNRTIQREFTMEIPELVKYTCHSNVNFKVCSKHKKFASINKSRLEAGFSFYTLLVKGNFEAFLLWTFQEKVDFLISNP